MVPGGVDQSCRTKTAIIGKLARAATATTMRKAELRASDRGGGARQVDAGVPNRWSCSGGSQVTAPHESRWPIGGPPGPSASRIGYSF